MNDGALEQIENQLADRQLAAAPTELRAAVLADIHRELSAARWDRRLARAAAMLLAIGVGTNLAMGLQSSGSSSAVRQVAGGPSHDSLVQVAVTVAEATDPETGSRFARQMAAMSGMSLSSEQSATIDAAVKVHARPCADRRKGRLTLMRIFPTKRLWKRLGVAAAILFALALIANGFMAWLTEHSLQTRIAAIRAAGDPASIADLAPKPIPDDQNAAAYLERLKPQLEAFSKVYARFLDKSPVGKAFEEGTDRGEPPTPEQIAGIRSILDNYPEIDAGLALAAACEQYASLADFTLGQRAFLEDVIDNRTLLPRTAARFNDWRTTVMIADGKAQDAAQLGLESLRLARLHDAEPLLVNYLVGMALRGIAARDLYDAIAAGPISPQLHTAIDEELAKHDDPQRLVRALKTDRAYSIALTASFGVDSLIDQVNPIWMKMVGWPMKRLYLGAVDSFDRVFLLATKPWNEIWRTLGSANSALPPTGDGVLADLLMPGLKAAFEADARDLATLRSLRIFNALRQYAEENGHEAKGLEDLPFPKEATIDPFSGEPLKLKHTDDGWIIYSVMDNGVDDGGDFIGMKDYGLVLPKYRATEKRDKPSDEEASAVGQ